VKATQTTRENEVIIVVVGIVIVVHRRPFSVRLSIIRIVGSARRFFYRQGLGLVATAVIDIVILRGRSIARGITGRDCYP